MPPATSPSATGAFVVCSHLSRSVPIHVVAEGALWLPVETTMRVPVVPATGVFLPAGNCGKATHMFVCGSYKLTSADEEPLLPLSIDPPITTIRLSITNVDELI